MTTRLLTDKSQPTWQQSSTTWTCWQHCNVRVFYTDRVSLLALLFYACMYVTAAVDKATTDFLLMTGVMSLMCALTSANRMTSWLWLINLYWTMHPNIALHNCSKLIRQVLNDFLVASSCCDNMDKRYAAKRCTSTSWYCDNLPRLWSWFRATANFLVKDWYDKPGQNDMQQNNGLIHPDPRLQLLIQVLHPGCGWCDCLSFQLHTELMQTCD